MHSLAALAPWTFCGFGPVVITRPDMRKICSTPDPPDLVPGAYQRCQHWPERADNCLCKGEDGLRRASLMLPAKCGRSGCLAPTNGRRSPGPET
jgi:hypothetical protein